MINTEKPSLTFKDIKNKFKKVCFEVVYIDSREIEEWQFNIRKFLKKSKHGFYLKIPNYFYDNKHSCDIITIYLDSIELITFRKHEYKDKEISIDISEIIKNEFSNFNN